ncbi:MAG: glycine cleavage system aminomethyltransferase GcvT [Burkholderiaceae bacterium]
MTQSLPLEALHRDAGARMGPFAGFSMPIQYPEGLKAEHLHTRSHAGLFDVSHMGQLRVTAQTGGSVALRECLEAALPVDFDGWPSGQQRYTALLNDAGGIEDDLMMVWRPGPEPEVRIVVNAGNREADLQRLQQLAPQLQFSWVDAALLALQGPEAEAVLTRLDPKAAALRFMESADLMLSGVACFTTRSGYTGEDGFEISVPRSHAQAVAQQFMADARVRWVGLGARDTLRLEAGLPLHGQDILPSVSPLEAGLRFAIAPSRRPGGQKEGGYPGAVALAAQWKDGATRRLSAFVSHQPVPIRAHATVMNQAGVQVGEVTSGTVSPSLGHPIVLALIDARTDPKGLSAQVRGQALPLTPVSLPFVPKRYKR